MTDKYKRINWTLLAFSSLSTGLTYFFIINYCATICTFESKRGWIDPIWSGGIGLTATFAFLLFFSSVLFRKWLLYIASWYVPASILLVSQISIYDSSVLAVGRGTAMTYCMMGLFMLTVVFVVGYVVVGRMKSKA